MNAEQLVIILAGFVTTLLGGVMIIIRWSTKRMDVKDDRYAEITKEDRDKFLALSDKYQGTIETRAEMFYKLSNDFRETTDKFNATMSEFMDKACRNIEQVAERQQKFGETWDSSRVEYLQAIRAIIEMTQTHVDESKSFMTGPFVEGIREEHQALLTQSETMKSFMEHVKDEHTLMVENLQLMNTVLCEVCGKLEVNGSALWNGVERRHEDEAKENE